ncbi:COG1629 Outer membrane receptor proteins [Vibrio sp. B1FLJ16]|uniref:TonB-dependent receptor n=1 Tax=Vibrio sp. B1FLJ16 TaxID=2751178 RepID=UPI0015F76EEA|nr:TonB-dependent receptor [Vibrio sp. B1FLJ16]CAD7805385.1 COG1629 Outer membrane receptor proteins [Vibrio sp. B1FLJ16]CAE6899628.1 COG1629 Outer membrane receptor proteins [Vibrio sp. B1FLJ16]
MNIKKGRLQISTVAMAVSAVCTVCVAQAQETITDEKIVVVSSRTPKAISDIPGTVWYISSEQIEREYRGGKSLGEILASTVPSLDVSSGARTNYGQNLRGRKMLVMIDGVSLQSSRQISRYLDSIDPFNIDRIEVLSGATSIYGAGASGGVINIISKKALSEDLEFESFVSGSSGFNSGEDFDYKLAQALAGGNDKLQARASVVYSETQGYFDANGDIATPDISQGSLQFNQTVDFLTTVGITLSETKQWNLLGQYYDSQQDSPYGLYIEGSDFIDVREGFDSDREHGTERIMLSASYIDEKFLGHQLIAEASYRKEDQTYTPYYQSSGQQITDVISLKAALAKSIQRFNIVYGIDAYQDKLDSNQALYDSTIANNSGNLINKTYAKVGRYPGIEVSSVAGFVQADYAISDDWNVEGGFRYQYIENEIDDFVGYSQQKKIAAGSGTSADAVPGGKTDYSVGLFNLGTIYHLNTDSQIWANFSQGFDLADPAKYYGQGNYTLVGDHWQLNDSINVNKSKMSGIKTDSFELGYRLDTGELNIQTAAYYSQSDKSVTYNKTTLLINEIDDKKRTYGLEAQASYWVDDNIQIGASGHYVVSEVKGDDGWEDFTAGEASTSKANAWAGWYDTNLALKLQGQTMFDYEDDSDNKLDGYTVFDLVGSYQLPVGSLGFGIQNLFDKDYTTIWGQRAEIVYSSHYDAAAYDYKGRGRTFTLNYQVSY